VTTAMMTMMVHAILTRLVHPAVFTEVMVCWIISPIAIGPRPVAAWVLTHVRTCGIEHTETRHGSTLASGNETEDCWAKDG